MLACTARTTINIISVKNVLTSKSKKWSKKRKRKCLITLSVSPLHSNQHYFFWWISPKESSVIAFSEVPSLLVLSNSWTNPLDRIRLLTSSGNSRQVSSMSSVCLLLGGWLLRSVCTVSDILEVLREQEMDVQDQLARSLSVNFQGKSPRRSNDLGARSQLCLINLPKN